MGDTKQHSSPDRGTAMRLLERHAGLPVAEVTDVKRQRGEYRKAVEWLNHVSDEEYGAPQIPRADR